MLVLQAASRIGAPHELETLGIEAHRLQLFELIGIAHLRALDVIMFLVSPCLPS